MHLPSVRITNIRRQRQGGVSRKSMTSMLLRPRRPGQLTIRAMFRSVMMTGHAMPCVSDHALEMRPFRTFITSQGTRVARIDETGLGLVAVVGTSGITTVVVIVRSRDDRRPIVERAAPGGGGRGRVSRR